MNYPLPSTEEHRSRGEAVARLPGLSSFQSPSFHDDSDTILISGTSSTRHNHHRGYSDLTAIIHPMSTATSSASGPAPATLPPIWNYNGPGLDPQGHALPHIQDGRGNGNSVQRPYNHQLPQWDDTNTHPHTHASSHSQSHSSSQKSQSVYGVGMNTSPSLFPNLNNSGFYDSRMERISRDNCKSTPPVSPLKPLSWNNSYGNDDSVISTGRNSERLLPLPASPPYSPKAGLNISPNMRSSPSMSPNMNNHQNPNNINMNSPKSGPARSRARNTPRSLYLPYSDALVREKLPGDRVYAFDVAIAFRNNHPGELIPNDLLNELLEEVEQGMFMCFCCPKNRKGRTITPARDHVRKSLGNFPFKCVNSWW